MKDDKPDCYWRNHRWFDDPQLSRAEELLLGDGRWRAPEQRLADHRRAAQMMKSLAERGNPIAAYCLGVWLRECLTLADLAPTLGSAASWFMRAASQGHVNALVRLGRCVATGDGVAADPRAAFELFAQAAKYADYEAQFELGNCHENGVGVPIDLEQAAQWYMKTWYAHASGRLIGLGYRMDWIPGTLRFNWVRDSSASIQGGVMRDPPRPARG